MSKIRLHFPLDAGNSMTAFSLAPADPSRPQGTYMASHGDDDRIPTCVLHDRARICFHIGDIAEQEYLLAREPVERAGMAFYANFKPHIVHSAEHRETALRFLTEVRRADRLNEKIALADKAVVLAAGCPVAWLS